MTHTWLCFLLISDNIVTKFDKGKSEISTNLIGWTDITTDSIVEYSSAERIYVLQSIGIGENNTVGIQLTFRGKRLKRWNVKDFIVRI